ncbi:DNA/RNA nuclease SfsA [Celerinatantimonas yamalensis]|uniref:Sugar fermentation stimulation protein homolog n=1 Tax=Celerinatantimonas yamalensis TaxID=559956 RepID=A0ABW9GBU7_9GAMM
MKFNPPLIAGRLVRRYKRFLADVELIDGSIITAHCANTGAMTGCAEPGWQVWLRDSQNPKRKCRYSWELVENAQGNYICINTTRANEVVTEAINNNQIESLRGYSQCTREVRYGEENSRIDLLLCDPSRVDCYIEVKSVTLLTDDGVGLFPDATTTRGQKHLRELTTIAQAGQRAVLLFAVMHSGIEKVSIAHHIDALYGQLLQRAIDAGVEVIAQRFAPHPERIEVDSIISFTL